MSISWLASGAEQCPHLLFSDPDNTLCENTQRNLRSHTPVTATERTVRMREKERYIENYAGAACRQGVLYSMILTNHIATRATSHWGLRAENWTTNLQYCQENKICSSANFVFYLFTMVLSLHEEEGVREATTSQAKSFFWSSPSICRTTNQQKHFQAKPLLLNGATTLEDSRELSTLSPKLRPFLESSFHTVQP